MSQIVALELFPESNFEILVRIDRRLAPTPVVGAEGSGNGRQQFNQEGMNNTVA